MYTESLRQYEFPDDINDPEYAERERTYRRWRRDLEQRYPQVCAECEPKVEAKLERASYTAKSDHVRRMLDRTRAQRQEVKKRGFLDVIDLAGKWSWNLAFALQLMWHILIFGALFVQWAGQNQSDIWAIRAFSAICQIVLGTMPSPDRLIGWAINTSLCSSPWNPRFKQTIRGFTSHILGFRQWYTYQLVIILIRYVCLLISQYNDSRGMTPLAQLGAHMVIMILMFDVSTIISKVKHIGSSFPRYTETQEKLSVQILHHSSDRPIQPPCHRVRQNRRKTTAQSESPITSAIYWTIF